MLNPKDKQKPKDTDSDSEEDNDSGGKTYGNEPPVKDPKKPQQPDHYEMNFQANKESNISEEIFMPRGSKENYTSKQKRQAQHIEESEKKRGVPSKKAAQIAWATVNKETGGAGKRVKDTSPSKRGGQKGGKAASRVSH